MSKPREMSDIKRIIGVLCKHINKFYNLNLKPEHFRLAKHDKSKEDVVKKLWKLLNKLTVNNISPDVNEIKDHFRNLRYSSHLFYDLPEDMSSGSRELLVAVSVVLNEGLVRAVENVLENSSFAKDFEVLDNKTPCPHKLDTSHIKTKQDFSHYKRWLEGKIKNNNNQISEYEIHNSKLLSQLKENVYVDVDSLSVLEILALNDQKYAESFLRESEDVLEVLQNHENWLRKSGMFWKWMMTVLEERR